MICQHSTKPNAQFYLSSTDGTEEKTFEKCNSWLIHTVYHYVKMIMDCVFSICIIGRLEYGV